MIAFFKKNIIQRAFYIICLSILLLGTILNSDWNILNTSSSVFGIKYLYLFIFLFVPFVYQILFNNRIGWAIILIMFLSHFVWTLTNIKSGGYSYLGYFILFVFYAITLGILILIYPQKKDSRANY